MKGIYMFLAPGYEPLEALAPVDILKRAKLDVRFVSTGSDHILPSTQGYGIEADMTWDEFAASDDAAKNSRVPGGCLIFPGGLPGADNLVSNAELVRLMREHFLSGGLVAAICAAPARMLSAGLGNELAGRRLTVYEGFENEIEACGAICTGAPVQEDGNLITAKGPGLAIDFGLAILGRLVDRRVYDVVRHAMMI